MEQDLTHLYYRSCTYLLVHDIFTSVRTRRRHEGCEPPLLHSDQSATLHPAGVPDGAAASGSRHLGRSDGEATLDVGLERVLDIRCSCRVGGWGRNLLGFAGCSSVFICVHATWCNWWS